MSLDMDIIIVAAVSKNGVIGKDGVLPWSLPSDLKHFKKLTSGGAIIMGRKTFESIGSKPLPKRHNIVVSSTMSRANIYKNLSIVPTLDRALWEAQEDFKEVFIIGGEVLYKEAMQHANKMIITHVDSIIKNGTAFFPYINLKTGWIEEARIIGEISSVDDHEYAIATYKKSLDSSKMPEFTLGPVTYVDGKDLIWSSGTTIVDTDSIYSGTLTTTSGTSIVGADSILTTTASYKNK